MGEDVSCAVQLTYSHGKLHAVLYERTASMIDALRGRLGWLPDFRFWIVALLLAVCGLAYQVRTLHLDDRLYYWAHVTFDRSTWESQGMQLLRFQAVIQAKPVIGVDDNLSGLAFDGDRDRLWGVINNPEQLISLDRQGNLLSKHALSGFQDVEGVAYLGDDLLVVIEERKQALLAVPVPKVDGAVIHRSDARGLALAIDAGENNGFEGLAYDRAGDRLFVVKEHSPMKLYEIRGFKRSLEGQFDLEVIDHQDWIERSVMATDLSSVEYDARTGHLLLLSDESQLLMELDHDGKLVGYRSLVSGTANLHDSVPQGEGVTIDDDGNLFLVSEPNLFYAFRRDR
jgi:uncharacterized protein YjiK